MKKCVAVLSRGHPEKNGYRGLVQRNEHISKWLVDKTDTDVIIFHEGNIPKEHQDYISSFTPELGLRFIDVAGDGFRKEKESVPVRAAAYFTMGYRHMCSFWFVDFWKFVGDYDMLLRIDDDCMIQFRIDLVFQDLQNGCLVSGCEEPDSDRVVLGLNDFTVAFMKLVHKKYIDKRHPITGPYTNVFGINLKKLKRNVLLRKYIERIDKSNRIYSHRWGDLPLWGEAVHYMLTPKALRIDKHITYYHASHDKHVNQLHSETENENPLIGSKSKASCE